MGFEQPLAPPSVNAHRRPARGNIGDENVGCAPAPFKGKERHEASIQTSYIDERLNEEKARIEAELEPTEPGPQRDLLELKLRQIETAREIEDWLSSTGPQRSSRRASQHERHAGHLEKPNTSPMLLAALIRDLATVRRKRELFTR